MIVNVTSFWLWTFQKADEISALPLRSSRFQSVFMRDVLRVIEMFEGRGNVSRAG